MIRYLIEYTQKGQEQASWWTGLWFSEDVEQAALFASRQNAEAALVQMNTAPEIERSRLAVTEHVWMERQHLFTVQLTRSEIMHLPLETRQRILRQNANDYLLAQGGTVRG